jgi:hypothetical protein
MVQRPIWFVGAGNGWNNQQWNQIEKAEAKMRNELRKSCSCHKNSANDSCIPCDLAETLLNRLDTVIVAYAPLVGECGFTPPGQTRGLFLSENAWNVKKCSPGCLTTTLYHELLHTVLGPDEPGVEALEQKCVGNLCKGSQ